MLKKVNPFGIGLILLFISAHVAAQEFLYDNYKKEQGLAGNIVYCISQDKDGFIWLGTDNGASRFDGYSFENFNVEKGLTDNEVLEIHSDSKGRTWFRGFSSSACYYYKGRIYNEQNDKALARAGDLKQIANIVEDSEHTIWLLAKRTVAFRSDGSVRDFGEIRQSLMSTKNTTVQLMLSYADQKEPGVMCFCSNRLVRIQPDGTLQKFPECTIKHADEEASRITIYGTVTSDPQYVYIYSRSGFKRVRVGDVSCELSSDMPSSGRLNSVVYDANSKLNWVSTRDSGAYSLDAHSVRGPTYLFGKNVSKVMTDRSGNVWFTTIGDGVYKIGNNKFRVYNESTGIADNNVQELFAGTDDLWIGMSNFGLQKYHNGVLSKAIDLRKKQYEYGPLKQFIINGSERIISYDQYLYINDGHLKLHSDRFMGAIKSLCLLNDTTLYLANHNGFFRFTTHNLDTITYGERFTTISNCSNGVLYAASVKNLYAVDGKEVIKIPEYNIPGHGRVSCMRMNSQNVLAIASHYKGIYYIYKDSLYSIGRNEGLASDRIINIDFQNDSTLWVVTDRGISKISLAYDKAKDNSVSNYYLSDDIPFCSINRIKFVKDTAWLATDRGLVYFDPLQLKKDKKYDLLITGIYNNEISHYGDYAGVPSFDYGSGNISIGYSAILFNGNNHLIFKYRLSGKDDSWNSTTQRKIEYASLIPGTYMFEVYAEDKNGIRSSNIDSVKFIIAPLWWQTVWFRISVAVALAACIALFIHYRIKRVKSREEEKTIITRKMSELKLEALRSQLSPHFIFNSLNAVQNFLVEHNAEKANEYLIDFSTMIRKSLRLSLNNFGLLRDEIEVLNSYLKLERMRFENAFDYEIVNDVIDKPEIMVPTMIFQHYAENAVKHGVRGLAEKGVIKVSFRIESKMLICEIEDNGEGINENNTNKVNEYGGLGIKLHAERAELISRSFNIPINITSINKSEIPGSGRGTLIKIVLPLIRFGENQYSKPLKNFVYENNSTHR